MVHQCEGDEDGGAAHACDAVDGNAAGVSVVLIFYFDCVDI